MIPVIAIVGRPNVGKSTLFNRFTRSQAALVADFPGLTRDRQYGEGEWKGQKFICIDTGGIGVVESDLEALMLSQAKQAIQEADSVLFLVDARDGLTPADLSIAAELRKINKEIYLIVNKVDGLDVATVTADFYQLGFTHFHPISATHGRGIDDLLKTILPKSDESSEEAAEAETGIKVAIVGRPNVGKSTLVNRMLGEERVIVYDQAGTTRDSIYIPFERLNERYTLIDTAGVRRKGRIFEAVEKFSIVKTLQAISDANVVLFLFDASENLVEQDLHLLGYILEVGKALVIAANKWDGLETYQRDLIKNEIDRRLRFVDFAPIEFISALHGTNVGHLYRSIKQVYHAAFKRISAKRATDLLIKAQEAYQPPLSHGRRIKLRYAHMGGQNPPQFIIHGNQAESVPVAYQRYLINYFRQALKLIGTPIRIEFKTTENPFKGRKNKLTPRQARKRRRVRE